MKATSYQEQIIAAFREASNSQSDRAAAIVSGSLLDEKIGYILRQSLLDGRYNSKSSTVHENMFGTMRPLSSFSAKIYLGYMLGIYTEHAMKDLHRIREIRNAFAHNLAINEFSHPDILKHVKQIIHFRTFLAEKGTPENELPYHQQRMWVEDLSSALADPRKTYLLAIHFYFAMLFSQVDVHDKRTGRSLCTPRI